MFLFQFVHLFLPNTQKCIFIKTLKWIGKKNVSLPLAPFMAAGGWLLAAGKAPLLPSWGQQQIRPRYTGLYHSRCWCSWSRCPLRTSAHSDRTGRRWRSSSRTLSVVGRLWEKGVWCSLNVTLKTLFVKPTWDEICWTCFPTHWVIFRSFDEISDTTTSLIRNGAEVWCVESLFIFTVRKILLWKLVTFCS